MAVAAPSATITVALVGNPNTGKTTLFNALAGMRQRVGNYPGVTVETKKGSMTHEGQTFHLIDLPGTYSLAPRSPDEMVAVDLILGHQEGEERPDVVLSIVDASNLERNLYLTTQVLEMGVPVVIALNMIDIAQAHGIHIDARELGHRLGAKVVPIQANKSRGFDELKQAVAEACNAAKRPGAANGKSPPFPDSFEKEVRALQTEIGNGVEPFLVRRLLLDVGGYTEERVVEKHGAAIKAQVQAARQRLDAAGSGVPAVEARSRYNWIREATKGTLNRPAVRPVTWTDKIDKVLTHKVWGSLIFLVMMFLVFQSIFTWAKPLMDLLTSGVQSAGNWVGDLPFLETGPLKSLIVDGLFKGVGSVVVFLPQILILFAFIAILEDCGYMARAAFLMDKLMARAGLSGKSFIPMLSSLACAIPGIMATRVIENSRDRLTTILVAPLMSCSARLPVYILLIGTFMTVGYGWWVPGLTMFAMYMVGIIMAPLVALVLKRTLLRGETPVFVMEMPLYKFPSIRLVLRRMFDAGWAFLYRAGTMIFASMIVVWALLYFPYANDHGESYPELIAALQEKIKEPKEEIETLEREITAKTKEMKLWQERIERGERVTSGQSVLPFIRKQEIETLKAQIETIKEKVDPVEDEINQLTGKWKSQSILGQLGHFIEPAVRPLGWDWRIGTAALASFPAREVVVGTLGIIYDVGEADPREIREAEDVAGTPLGRALQSAEWDNQPGRKVFTIPTVLSLLVFFALCAQCASTLAIIKRETRSWRWPIFTFVYMTALAYIGALIVYQIGSRLS